MSTSSPLITRVVRKARHLLAQSPPARVWRDRQRRRILTREFIASENYSRMMMTDYDSEIDGTNSAELETDNFVYRHRRRNDVLGAWRWLGTFEKRDQLIDHVFDESLTGVDLGGARGPISLGAHVCDRLERDVFGRSVRYQNLADIPDEGIDYLWTSHTLEHISDLDEFVREFSAKLKSNGKAFIMVPAFTCVRWRAGVHRYADAAGDSSHQHTFCLAADGDAGEAYQCTPIDDVIARHLRVESASMVGDNSIFIVATR